MITHSAHVDIRTTGASQLLDITDHVAAELARSRVRSGLLTVYVPHTTAAVTINENADPDVAHDILCALDVAVPKSQPFYRHSEGNSAAHLKSSIVGCSLQLPVVDGRMPLGTWQGIYFCEFDGPRTRQVLVHVIGE